MLSQRMTKSLFDMQYSLSESAEQNRVIDELIFTKNLFDSTLNAFASGGVIKGADGRDIAISEVTDSTAKDAVSQTINMVTCLAFWGKCVQIIGLMAS